MQTDYPCRIPRLKGKPFPLSFSFPKGTGCPAGEKEYARANAACWQNAAIEMFSRMPKIDKSAGILRLSCLISAFRTAPKKFRGCRSIVRGGRQRCVLAEYIVPLSVKRILIGRVLLTEIATSSVNAVKTWASIWWPGSLVFRQ